MPRAKSGNPPWPMVACKLPADELDALRRYADIHRCTLSDVLREGLALKLADAAPAQPRAAHIPVDVLLKDALRHGMNCPQCRSEYASPERSALYQAAASRLPSSEVQEELDVRCGVERGVAQRVSDEDPGFDSTKFVLGKLCKGKHEYGATGRTLLSLRSRNCPKCANEQKQQKRAMLRDAAAAPTPGRA